MSLRLFSALLVDLERLCTIVRFTLCLVPAESGDGLKKPMAMIK